MLINFNDKNYPEKEGLYLTVYRFLDVNIWRVMTFSKDLHSVDEWEFPVSKPGWYDFDSEWGYTEYEVDKWWELPEYE